ncbi:MAG: hypothetical protein A7316_09165 [Candidatus Altiarchaeales archaeon WOR_SM1_86-2]|nr:MAG: hypothetical protein A7316_09165 [Candidatus Altiarchaeales archaeon WOR_SM1_86-2]
MTICIAAIGKCKEEDKEAIVFATDHMVSIRGIGEFEHEIDKFKVILNEDSKMVAMLAGAPLLFGGVLKDIPESANFSLIKEKIHENLLNIRKDKIQRDVFNRFNINWESIPVLLQHPQPTPVIMRVLDFISNFTLGTNILLIGFEDNVAQIADISENDYADFRDINFHAIGSGSMQAENTLLFQRHSKKDKLSTVLYNVYKAKRNSEVSVGVGKETDIKVMTQEDICLIDEENLTKLSQIYDNEIKSGKENSVLEDIVNSLEI